MADQYQGWTASRTEWCRWDIGPLCDPPTQPSSEGQRVSSWFPHLWHSFYHIKFKKYTKRNNIWILRSAQNFVVYIPQNPVNSYDSDDVILIPISTLGDEKQNLPFFCLHIFPQNSLGISGHVICHQKDIYKEIRVPLENGSVGMEIFKEQV